MRKLVVAGLAGAVLAGGVASVAALQDRTTTATRPSPVVSPYPSRTALLPTASGGPVPTTAGLTAALGPVLRAAGPTLSLSVVDAATGRALLALGADRSVIPASTTKLLTATAALTVLDPDRRFVTRVVAGATGSVVLVGGGDPSLDRVGLASLAAQVRQSGTAVRTVVVDDSLFAGPRTGPGWKPGYVQHGDVAPVSALAVEQGRTSDRHGSPRVQDTALAAGQQLARLLGAGAVVRGRAAGGAAQLAAVSSPPVSDLVEGMLRRSDNDYAEALGRQVALATGRPPTFAGEVAAIGTALRGLGVQVALQDASGLSPLDRVQPGAVTALLARASGQGRYGPLLSGLPVGGFDGTLAERFRSGAPAAAAGEVRAKTGTLDGVSALAGLVVTRDGRLLAFDATLNGVALGATGQAQQLLDRLSATLAGCGCVR